VAEAKMVNPWFSWSEFSRTLAKAAAAVHPPVTKRWKWRRGGGREKPFEGIKDHLAAQTALPSGRKTSATSHRCLEELAFQYP
jgi:hypothetical protein